MVLLPFLLTRLFPVLHCGMGHCQVLSAWRKAPKIHTKPSTETEAPDGLHLTSKLFIFFPLPTLANTIVQFTAERGHKLIALSQEFISINSKLLGPGLASKWREAHISAVPLVCSLSTVEMSWDSGKETEKTDEWHFWHKETKEMAPLLESQNFPGKLRLEREKWRAKARAENASCASLLPTWTECLTQKVTLKFLLEVDSSSYYCENLAYLTKQCTCTI